jgi:3-deoxy-manno-octulosonate cytidylyltransferase (CMP-KDO synthetase)
MSDSSASFHVVIPARYDSSRLPGKPLEMIGSKTMIQRVFENAAATGADQVLVATDDERIRDAVLAFGGSVRMTDPGHRSGTDRIAEVATAEGWSRETLVVNLQGDEPYLPPQMVRTVARSLIDNPAAGISTLAHPIDTARDLTDPNVVKVATDSTGLALYFSRAPIPYPRDFDLGDGSALPRGVPFLRHIGLYAYRVGALRRISDAPPSELEVAESLEQLRALQLGIKIHVTVVEDSPGRGIDTEEDLLRARQMLEDGC